jgi:hypothetical protein
MQPCVRVLAVAIALTLALTLTGARVNAATDEAPATVAADADTDIKLPPLAPGEEVVVLVKRPLQASETVVFMLPPAQAQQSLERSLAAPPAPPGGAQAAPPPAPEITSGQSGSAADVGPSRLPTAGGLDLPTGEPSRPALAGIVLVGLGLSMRRAGQGPLAMDCASLGSNRPLVWPSKTRQWNEPQIHTAPSGGAPHSFDRTPAGYAAAQSGSSGHTHHSISTGAVKPGVPNDRPDEPAPAAYATRNTATVLEAARRFVAAGSPYDLASELLESAVALLEVTGGLVTRWDEERGVLIPVCRRSAQRRELRRVRPGQGASGRAIQRRAPVILNVDQRECDTRIGSSKSGGRASMAAPLHHEGRLLGAVELHISTSDGRRFTDEDAAALEALAAIASAGLVGLERAQLEGALLAARSAQHEVNNRLAVMSGYAELLAQDATLLPHLRQAATMARQEAKTVAAILSRFQRLTRLEHKSWGPGIRPTIDVSRSTDAQLAPHRGPPRGSRGAATAGSAAR